MHELGNKADSDSDSEVSKDIPVYELKPERGKGRSRVLHRNLLLPCDQLPLETSLQHQSKKRTATRSAEGSGTHSEEDDDDDDDDDNDADEYYPVSRHLSTHPNSPHPEDTPGPPAHQDTQLEEVLQETEPEADQPLEGDIGQVEDIAAEAF
ncbi:hypothetical protein ILYODFUR_006966 [Ilyodon furcidens]|uniref:Uncharacterized protein n=1 Tax=Ilyodon furcidens TaxID=33524 RepID=A0ABV0TJ45_9TELE